jgi:DNA-binding IclR family transcriptional regulator
VPRPSTTDPSPPTTRVVEVLNLLGISDGGISASEVARRLGITLSTTAAILAALDNAGFAQRDKDKAYRLGPGLLPLASAARRRFPLADAQAELERLSTSVGCGATLTGIADDHLFVVLAVGAQGRRPLGVAPGDHFPLGPPYGAIAVAWRDDAEVDRWLAQAPLSPHERDHERGVMRDIRARGFGVWSLGPRATPLAGRIQLVIDALAAEPGSRQLRDQLTELFALFGRRGYTSGELIGHTHVDVGYALAAVFGPDSQPRYQIDLHLLRARMTTSGLRRVLTQLVAAADHLTEAIGGQAPLRTAPPHGHQERRQE